MYLREMLGEAVIVTTSHEIAHESREYERVSTAALNAYIAPNTKHHVDALSEVIEGKRISGCLYMDAVPAVV